MPATAPEAGLPLSVTELTADIKRLLEQRFSSIRVAGEVSRLTRHASGHLYFTVKDSHAAISAVVWRSAAARLSTLPEEGKSFVFSGHISLYEPQGRYQLIVSRIEVAGAGQLAEEFERRKRLFAERGWFDAARKRPVVELPRHIGIVTSPTAAALEDVKKVLASRPGWLQLTLAPCIVQGAAAPSSIRDAIRRLNDLAAARPDTILLVRGGGSIEDLWCFNDELVVQAVVESAIPVISGIGHEIDTTLADFAADLRAATPSNAAELACPDRQALKQRLPRLPMLMQLLSHRIMHAARQLQSNDDHLRHALRLMQDKRYLDVERRHNDLVTALDQAIRRQRTVLKGCRERLMLQEPHRRLRRQQAAIHGLRQRLVASAANAAARQARLLERLDGRLHALSPMRVLRRGYTMTLDREGRLIASAAGVMPGSEITVRFHDGEIAARTTNRRQAD